MKPKEYRYTQEHEWICPEAGNKGKIGLTNYAQSRVGDIIFLDLLAPGTKVEQREKIGEVEAVKAVSEIFAPVSGLILEINQTVIDEPQLVNQDPYGDGWLVSLEISQPAELDALMDSEQYDKFVTELSEEASE